MPRNKLAKLLLENDQAIQTDNGSSLSQFGLESITNIAKFLKDRISRWNPDISDYDPLFEIAKIAYLTTDERLAFNCHQTLASYQYPQIRSLEVQAKEDKEIRIKVELAGYARTGDFDHGSSDNDGDEVEDIEAEGDLIAEDDYDKTSSILDKDTGTESSKTTKQSKDYLDQVLQQSSKKGREL